MNISRKKFLKSAALIGAGGAFLNQNLFAKSKTDPLTCPGITCNMDLTSDTTFYFSDVVKKSYSYAASGPLDPAFKDIKFYREYASNNINLDCVNNDVLPDEYKCEDDPRASLVDDVYYPTKFNGSPIDYSTCTTLPMVLFAHSGGFSDCSSKDQPGIATYCTEFAKKGFITASCEYRRGVQLDFNNRVYTTVQQEIGMYRACQDVRGFIRTVIQKHGAFNGDFAADVNSVFLAGNSAGSFAMLNAAYYPYPSMVYPLFPKLASSSVTIQQALGPINADFYDCDSSISYIGNIRGLLNCWGSISLPYSYYNNNEWSYFQGRPNPPVISFHGLLDTVFPINRQHIRFPPMEDAAFTTESRCLKTSPFKTVDTGEISLENYGSLDLVSKVLIPLNVFYEVYIDCQMAHGLDNDCICNGLPNLKKDKNNPGSCISCVYQSDFGSGAQNTTDTIIYIVKRAATFFQAILNGKDDDLRDDPTIHHYFYDCMNRRKRCQLINNDDDCGNSSCS